MFTVLASLSLLLISDSNAGLLMAPISLVELKAETAMRSTETMSRIMQNMTVSHAFHILHIRKKMPEDLVALIQKLEQHKDNREHKRNELRGTAGATPTAAPAYSGLKGAQKMLSEMMLESTNKLDMEKVKCAEAQSTQRREMEETRQDIASYNSASASARGRILSAQTQIEMLEEKIPQFESQLMTHNAECKKSSEIQKAQIALVENDISVMTKVLELTECKTALMQLGVVRCQHGRHHGKHHGSSGTSFITFGHSVVRRALQGLKSQAAKKELQWGLAQVFSESTSRTVMPAWHPASVLLQKSSTSHLRIPGLGGMVNTSDAPNRRTQIRKCSISGNPGCTSMRDKFLLIQTGIMDKVSDMKDDLAKHITECKKVKENYEAQIADGSTRLKEEQTKLSVATAEQNAADEQSRLKGIQLVQQHLEYLKTMTECQKQIENYQSEICGSSKIRGELTKLAGQNSDLFVQDCVVSDWTPEECSATCAGGMQKLSRSVTVLPIGDAMTCPPLVMERTCNEQGCPIDCILESWSGWSSCSTQCGGGVMERSRAVEIQAENGGDACGQTTEAGQCNIQSCDKDCELAGWTQWSSCSAACDGGFLTRKRHVSKRAVGNGECPSEVGPKRVQFEACNMNRCMPAFMAGLTTSGCESKLDIFLLLDGSGSLGQAGFDAVKIAGSLLAKAFGGEAKVGALLFSGPSTWKNYWKCITAPKAGLSAPNMAEPCGLRSVDHFSADHLKVASDIEALTWPKGGTFSSGALAVASAELSSGRSDAKTIVIMFTDGMPMSRSKTLQQAKLLRNKVDRFMVVPVGPNIQLNYIKTLVLAPENENVLVIKNFDLLKEPSTMDDIISNVCPNPE